MTNARESHGSHEDMLHAAWICDPHDSNWQGPSLLRTAPTFFAGRFFDWKSGNPMGPMGPLVARFSNSLCQTENFICKGSGAHHRATSVRMTCDVIRRSQHGEVGPEPATEPNICDMNPGVERICMSQAISTWTGWTGQAGPWRWIRHYWHPLPPSDTSSQNPTITKYTSP